MMPRAEYFPQSRDALAHNSDGQDMPGHDPALVADVRPAREFDEIAADYAEIEPAHIDEGNYLGFRQGRGLLAVRPHGLPLCVASERLAACNIPSPITTLCFAGPPVSPERAEAIRQGVG